MAADFSGMDLEIFADMMTAVRCRIDILTDQPAETKLSASKTCWGTPPGRTTTIPSGRFSTSSLTWPLGTVCPVRPYDPT